MVPMDPVQTTDKQMISVDPSSFSSMLLGVFDAWYKQRFGQETKTTTTTTTKHTTPNPAAQSKSSGIDKKALFNEFLTLAIDYFKPKAKQSKPKPAQDPPDHTKQAAQEGQAKETPGAPDPPDAPTKKSTSSPKKITHPPVLTRESKPAAKTPAEKPIVDAEAAAESGGGGSGTAKSAGAPQKKKSPPRKPQRTQKNNGPPIDPEFLADINEIRVLQGLPELRANQVDQYGNVLPKYRPPPPPTSPNREIHGHSHSPHDHYHDHLHGHSHDYGHGLGFGAESYIQSSIHDTHARAHAMAGPLSASVHRELHRLLKNRERTLRREAWERRRLREELFGGGPVLRSVVDSEALGDIAAASTSLGAGDHVVVR